jgi:hypothetical protein
VLRVAFFDASLREIRGMRCFGNKKNILSLWHIFVEKWFVFSPFVTQHKTRPVRRKVFYF